MTTIITPQSNNSDSGVGMIVGVLLGIIVIGTLFFIFVLPRIQDDTMNNQQGSADINVTIPSN